MNYFLRHLVQSRRQTTDRRQTENDTYEPIMQIGQVGSMMGGSIGFPIIWVDDRGFFYIWFIAKYLGNHKEKCGLIIS